MKKSDIHKHIRLAKNERYASEVKEKIYMEEGRGKSSLIYRIRKNALDVYINHLYKKLKAKEAIKGRKRINY